MPKIVYAKVYKERLLSAALKEIKKHCVTAKEFVKILRATGQTSLLFDHGTLVMNFDELSAIGFLGLHGSVPFLNLINSLATMTPRTAATFNSGYCEDVN